MADENEIIVNVEGEEGGSDDVIIADNDAVAELKRQHEALKADVEKRDADLAVERAARFAADQRAADARAREAALHTRVTESQGDAIASGIDAAQAEASQAEADYAALMERGDFAGAAKAQRRMAAAEARILRFDEAKSDLEARKSAPRTDDTPSRADPVEAHLAKFTEPTARWLRDHKEWLTDPRKNAKLTGAHHFAVAEGYDPDTPGYFEHVEKTLGLRDEPQPARNGSGNGQAKTPARRSAPPVAPVNGSAGAHSSGSGDNRGNQVYLTKNEAASATDGTLVWNYDDPSGKDRYKKGQPIGIQEMARRKLEMQKRGLYDKNAIEA
jgi:hypothetical protein